MPRPRIFVKKEDTMQEDRVGVPIVGVAMFVGFGLNQLGDTALIITAVAICAMALSMVFIWVRVGELTEKTSDLTNGVDDLNTKVKDLEKTMAPSQPSRR